MKKMKKKSASKITTQTPAGYVANHRDAIDDNRWINAKKRRSQWGKAINLDQLLVDENGEELENLAVSDCGAGAERIRQCGEAEPEQEWLTLMRKAVGKMKAGSKKHKFYLALLNDLRPTFAARNAGISRRLAYNYLAEFREMFTPAHEEWKEERKRGR